MLKAGNVKRVFVEKKEGFNVEARGLLKDLKDNLGLDGLYDLKIVNRYDVEGISDCEYEKAKYIIFSEPPVDNVFDEAYEINKDYKCFAIEYLPGQYDQRADSAAQCIQMLTEGEKPLVRVAKLIILDGKISNQQFEEVKKYVINPVESREAEMDKPDTLKMLLDEPSDVNAISGFIDMTSNEVSELVKKLGLAMSEQDLEFTQAYFRDEEKRNPTITEIRMLDTYWSDHCRHTTFLTSIDSLEIEEKQESKVIKEAYDNYIKSRQDVYGNRIDQKPICLMDMATLAMKQLKKDGKLNNLDESEEINACSIVVTADVDGKDENWLVMFKNETHNHPTEIEPFGGAATCLGGAIRDPLSGRSYVYQAMRVTGSGDPRKKLNETLSGKLPQRKITTGAAAGYSSYGNQIGLATGKVTEVYDEGYIAKRLEIGAVVGAAPKDNVRRERPDAGDIIVLLGGRTGRDGCGGATGSSKEHNEDSLTSCGSEVQKGNPPTERKLQRLFRNPTASKLIKRCNDFGAGGISVAIGELADGLSIDLDLVPKKYEGLDGTELAISESQERMAVVVEAKDVDKFIEEAAKENLEATVVAYVTDDNRLRMKWKGKTIVDLCRDFINTNGVTQHTTAKIVAPSPIKEKDQIKDIKTHWLNLLGDLNHCSQKGLGERFDSTIGAGSVIMPFGGKNQLTPAEGMIAKLPVLKGETSTVTMMAHGFDSNISKWSPFHGAAYAIIEAVSRLVAMGADYKKSWLTLQEYFERLGDNPERWGKPVAALLGAIWAQEKLGIAAIGGKDSMSGTFKDMDVPPTLVAFALAPGKLDQVLTNNFKKAGSNLYLLRPTLDDNGLPDMNSLKLVFEKVYNLMLQGKVLSAGAVKSGGLATLVAEMAFGDKIGVKLSTSDLLFNQMYGAILIETESILDEELIGVTISEEFLQAGDINISIIEALETWMAPLEKIFPTSSINDEKIGVECNWNSRNLTKPTIKVAKPRVVIPVFPGTNCEVDSARSFERAGAITDTLIVKNLNSHDVEESVEAIADSIKKSQIIMFPGGFSAGDEPDGSGKFIATAFRNPMISEAVMDLLYNRDGLILGICNGFQALIKLGLLPYGEIRDMSASCPTLTFNSIGRHVSCYVNTRVSSVLSPWLSNCELGSVHTIPVSHGEGRFVANDEVMNGLIRNGQIAFQYTDENGIPSSQTCFNPNGSLMAVEGITSPDGRVLGKMGHSERIGHGLSKNISGNKDQMLFESGVKYFK